MIAKRLEYQLSPNHVIDVSKPFHVSWWAENLGVTEQDLIRAVHAAGVRAIAVHCYLSQKHLRSTERRSHRRLHDRLHAEEKAIEPVTSLLHRVVREGIR